MAKIIAQRELRDDNAKVMDAVVLGETSVVTRNGVPVAELRPVGRTRRTFASKADLAALVSGPPHVDLEQFRIDLDRAVDQRLSMSIGLLDTAVGHGCRHRRGPS